MNLKQLLWLTAAGGPSGPKERTITGNPVTFSTNYDLPMALEIPFSPVQDLHGYDHPWPGGGGKNLIPSTTSVISNRTATFTPKLDTDGNVVSYLANGTPSGGNANFNFASVTLSAGTYYLGGCPSGGSGSTYRLHLYDGTNYLAVDQGNGTTFTLTESKTLTVTFRVYSGYSVNNLEVKPILCLDSLTDKSYAPYSNICPISGWDGANVSVSPTLNAQDATVYPITFPTSAGTVYGGTLTVNADGTGTLVVNKAYEEFDGSADESWAKGNPDRRFHISLQNNTVDNDPYAIANEFETSTTANGYNSIWIQENNKRLNVYFDNNFKPSDASALKTWLSSNPLQVCYSLATPTVTTLTPGQVKTIVGLNNVWSNTNGENQVTYIK